MADPTTSFRDYGAKQTADDIAFFTANYDIIVNRVMASGGPKEYLGNKDDACRFCGLSAPAVRFSKIPHTIPELLGNRTLVSHYECDTCNARFGQLEADLGAMTVLERLASQVRGKGGVPSAKTKQGKSRIDLREHGYEISQYEGDEFLEIDAAAKTMTLTVSPQKFRPLAVYKSLLKAALSIVDDADVAAIPEAMAWLRAEGLMDSIIDDGMKFSCIRSFTPGPAPIRTTRAMVLRLKNDDALSPQYLFVVGAGNTTYQITLPCPQRDQRLIGKSFALRPIPVFACMDGEAVKGPTRFRRYSYASAEKVDAPASITFAFDSIERTNLDDTEA